MEIRAYDADDTAAVLAATSVHRAASAKDTPQLPLVTLFRRTMQLRHGWDGSPRVPLLATVDGEPVAEGRLELGTWDNRDLGWLYVSVHPDHRRRGIGSQVLAHAMDAARERDCTKLTVSGWDAPATRSFATHHGLRQVSVDVLRVLDPTRLPAGFVDGAWAEAAARAGDYELTRMEGRTPVELLPVLSELTAAINDAPLDDHDMEEEQFPVERIAAYESATLASGRRLRRVVARHRPTGEPAGHTVVSIDAETPTQAEQDDTAVVRAHRGHRLGLLLKAEMLRWLAESEPQVSWFETWNAESNTHMIAVNERLRHRVVARELSFQRSL